MLPPPPRGRYEDEKRLREKIEQHFNLSHHQPQQQQEAVIPKPNLQPLPSNKSVTDDYSINKSLFDTIRRQLNWTRIQLPDGEDIDPEIRKRRQKIKQMMITAWDSYRKYAWGENELKPLSKKGHAPGVFGKTK
ncbi:hypothetical protein BLA29_014001, partial [Euroglyphus maynei]